MALFELDSNTPFLKHSLQSKYIIQITTSCIVNNLWILHEQNRVDRNDTLAAVFATLRLSLKPSFYPQKSRF